jgi:hypothetical protein
MSLTTKEEAVPGKHDVYVLEVDGEFRVRPAVAIVEGGNNRQLKIRNLTGYEIELDLPNGLLAQGQAQQPTAKKKSRPNSGPGGPDKLTLSLDGNADGDYAYHVYVLKNGGRWEAVGESGPKIIVDP